MTSEIRIVAILQAKPGQAAAVENAMRAIVAPSRAEPACHFYTPHRDPSHEGRYVFIERWASREALAEHEETAHFKQLLSDLDGLLSEAPQVMILEELPLA
ncbi:MULTISPECIES: putative quinol monooxygenase [Pseudomonas]|jgi:quinol monooxygenase YgiN|uniref:Antibiotic biosynthesis monooxygenase n=1 Tax=Pseudomonas oryzihabitans TaxID=47885 RepID=A0A178LMT5_9PSED|nr:MULTISPECIES: putative quinol monooxygenase [Pseudomonas]MCD4865737.1 antibiotic biosynthesis monooxygenase [Pseudomonas sp. PLB05]MXS18946.1 antibiotic biosynthesis monooxygenase [Pseudomonas oryzihabitans]NRH40293.1 antibiotic biosynthesis monooxygenase [Pseudomonas sp. MS15a(2019)]OAN32333.1 antibiotic biosynthesis monooxygenase [Pseudomonas oryzihabitans]SEO61748.1 Quinol monooxygenase YgiN [Pseudomonas sp. Snoq117.2]